MQGTLAEIRAFAGNFAPRTWAFCAGQIIAISQNNALFSLLGCTYGGDCRTTFALPDCRGRAIIGAGAGPGLSNRALGQKGGVQTETLNITQMPAHTHSINLSGATASLNASNAGSSTDTPDNTSVLGVSEGGNVYNDGAPNVSMRADAISINLGPASQTGYSGGGQQINVMQPYISLNWIICMFGIYPSRN